MSLPACHPAIGSMALNRCLHRGRTWAMGLLVGLSALLLAGCATPWIDTRYTAQGQDSRAQFLILQYTDLPLDSSVRVLTQQSVSAHYLVSDETPPVVYRLVDEQRRAWHAGLSFWKGATMIHAPSLRSQSVNPPQHTLH